MNICLVDRDGYTVRMTKEDIAESLQKMGNKVGGYLLVPYHWGVLQSTHGKGEPVIQFRAYRLPNYSWWQVKVKEWRWYRKQKAIERTFKANNTKNLIWKPTPFVLEMPWLRLKGKKAVTINVE